MEVNIIMHGDALAKLKELPDKSVHCIVTSCPYYNLRDYQCEGQIGLEDTPQEFVKAIVAVFAEAWRVLRDDGTLWLNIGDSYAATSKNRTEKQATKGSNINGSLASQKASLKQKSKITGNLKPKDLIGIPWMVAFALRDWGWYLRQDIIWHKPNPMPESVTDRCTKSHEYIFLLSKSAKYYYDQEAIMQPVMPSTQKDARLYDDDYSTTRPERGLPGKRADQGNGLLKRKSLKGSIFDTGKTATATNNGRKSGNKERKNGSERGCPENTGSNVCASVPWEGIKANKRSVWTVTTKPFSSAHFATFPPELIVDCIKAGCPVDGICLDPFFGAGTTGVVARKLGRNFIGIELNEKYINEIALPRLQSELGLFL